jgi:TPR repeat protein
MILFGDGIPMNKSQAAYYFKLTADQGYSEADMLKVKEFLRTNNMEQNISNC